MFIPLLPQSSNNIPSALQPLLILCVSFNLSLSPATPLFSNLLLPPDPLGSSSLHISPQSQAHRIASTNPQREYRMRARGAFVHQSGGSGLSEGEEGAYLSWGCEGYTRHVCYGGAESFGVVLDFVFSFEELTFHFVSHPFDLSSSATLMTC